MTTTPDTQSDQAAANTALVAAFIDELFTAGDLTAIDRYLDPAMVNHDPPMDGPPGLDGWRHAATTMRTACPDWHSDRLHMVAEGDLVAEHFVASGTHTGPLFGVAPTGATLTLAGINLFRVRDGRVVERWGTLDQLGMLRQLGLVPGS
ncbi:MAG TPA: ester cyclase [Sporichthya sp.]|jgi:predicted ester cyclase|nr:ester cyclase [Sporichthya sp.]